MAVSQASTDGTIAMWTLNGAMVGQFGQKSPWSLDDSGTFRAPTPDALELDKLEPARPLLVSSRALQQFGFYASVTRVRNMSA